MWPSTRACGLPDVIEAQSSLLTTRAAYSQACPARVNPQALHHQSPANNAWSLSCMTKLRQLITPPILPIDLVHHVRTCSYNTIQAGMAGMHSLHSMMQVIISSVILLITCCLAATSSAVATPNTPAAELAEHVREYGIYALR